MKKVIVITGAGTGFGKITAQTLASAGHRALRRAQSTLKKGDAELSHWIHFFLESMVKQKAHLEEKLKKETLIGALPEISSQILQFINDHGKATVAQVVAATGKNRNTVKAHLQRLVKEKRLCQHGKGKGTWYAKL